MRKTITVMLLSLLLGATVMTPAFAGWWGRGPGDGWGRGAGPGNCGGPCASWERDDDRAQARQDFMAQTLEQRRQLHDKKDAYRDLMRQANPNKEEAAKLWSEIFDLQTKLQQMAAAAGIDTEPAWRDGDAGPGVAPGCGCGNGPRSGRGGCGGPRGRW